MILRKIANKIKKIVKIFFDKYSENTANDIYSAIHHLEDEILFKTQISMMCGNLPSVFSAMKNDTKFWEKIDNFKNDLDTTSCQHVDMWIKKSTILPRYYGDSTGISGLRRFNIPHATGLFTPEELFLANNYEQIISDLKVVYAKKYNIEKLPFSLHVHYFNCGLIYIPDLTLERAKSKIALDCGAWVGDTAIMLNMYGFKEIHSFEPIPSTYAQLRQNLDQNSHTGNFYCYPKAVGDEAQTLLMKDAGYCGGGSRIDMQGDISVESIVLDDMFLSHDVGVIKIDVEGFEENVLRGASEIIKKDKPILLIAAYHEWSSPGQMFRILDYIKGLDPGYKFLFRGMAPEYGMVYEYDVICYVP